MSLVHNIINDGGTESLIRKYLKTGVITTASGWIQRKLGLKVNMTKAHITRPLNRKYIGFGFYKNRKTKEWKSRSYQEPVMNLKGTDL